MQIFGACPHDCPDTCGVITEVENGRAVNFYANPDHPITKGWLCAKVRSYLDHVYHPDRLQFPLRRVGAKGGGAWERISWDEAIAEIGDQWRRIIAEYGAEAILPYSYSGTLGLIQMGVASGRFWNRLGASQLDRAICGAAAEFAVQMTLGKRWNPAYEDIAHSRVVMIWGHNPVSSAPHFMPHLLKAQKNGCKVIVIDPQRTRTAKKADWHIAPRPGTDSALALGMARIMATEGLLDLEWLEANTVGWPALRERLAECPPERAAEITGLPISDIRELAHLYAINKPSLIKIADGLQRHRTGGQTMRAIAALPAISGQYGTRGGGLMYSASGRVSWDSEAVNHWQDCPPPARTVNMNRLGAALTGETAVPPIKSLFVFGANPATSSPNAGLIREGMLREDLFTVVHELFMTDTAVLADIILPATSQLEQVDLHKAYGHAVLVYNGQAIAPLGESKSNWDVMRLLAREMGFADSWLKQSADEAMAEVWTATAVNNSALRDISLEQLKEQGFIALQFEPEPPFADGVFPTPSGKVELYSQTMADMGLEPLPNWREEIDDGRSDNQSLPPHLQPEMGLTLISAAAHHFTSSAFANQPAMLKREGEPFVEIHPQDAALRGIGNGDMVILENGRGWCKLRAKLNDDILPGVLSSPKGRWAQFSDGRNVNWTTSDALADMAGQSTFHSNAVWITNELTTDN